MGLVWFLQVYSPGPELSHSLLGQGGAQGSQEPGHSNPALHFTRGKGQNKDNRQVLQFPTPTQAGAGCTSG